MITTMSSFEVSYEYPPNVAADVYWTTLWRRQAGFLVSSILIAVLAVKCLVEGIAPAFWAFWLGCVCTRWAGWLLGHSWSRHAARDSPILRLIVEPAGLTLRSRGATTQIPWTEIRRIEVLKPALLLERRSGPYVAAIPPGVLSAEQRALLEEYVRGARGQVR